jgi:predicted RNA-binding protein Jag
MNSFTSTLNSEKKIKFDKQGNYIMKSVIAQGSTIAKAIEEGLKKADMPQEFFVKVLEDAQAGFLGFGSKKAKIALFFKNVVLSDKAAENMFSKGSYAGLFNNPNIKKQLDQQLKELGFEIKAMDTKKQEPKPMDTKKQELNQKIIKKDFTQNQVKVANLQIRPLGDKNQVRKPFVPKTSTNVMTSDTDSSKDQDNQNQQQAKTGENKYRRYYRYRRNRYNKNRSDADSSDVNSNNSNNSNSSDRDE